MSDWMDGVDGVEWSGYPLDCYDYQSTCGANNVDAKEEEDNNMDVLCVQTFHNDKFWREC